MTKSIEEEFLEKVIETQGKLQRIASQREFENCFVSTEKNSYISNLKSTKKMLKTYYLQQFSIKQKFSKKEDENLNQNSNKRFSLKSIFKKKDRNEIDEQNIYKFNFKLIKCQTISKFEKKIKAIDMVDTFTSIEPNEDLLNLITFSVLPSYYNFFLTEDDVNNFVDFLKRVYESPKDQIYFQTYSSIIYYTPFFLNFCHNIIFKKIIIKCLHNPNEIIKYSKKKEFYNKIIKSIEKNQHFCPPLLISFFEVFSKIENFSLSDHIKNNFFLPLFKNPIQFSVIREFDFLPNDFFEQIEKDEDEDENENKKDENENKKDENENQGNDIIIEEEEEVGDDDSNSDDDINNTDYIGRFIHKINKIQINDRLLISGKKAKNGRIFSSFDINIIQKPAEIKNFDFTDYCFYFYSNEEEDDSNPNQSVVFSNENLKIFKELLKLADPLPSSIKPPKNKEELFSIMEEYLVENGDFNTQFERRVCFENFKNYVNKSNNNLTLLMKKMKSSEFINEQSLNANKKRLDKVIQKKQSWSVITTIIHPQLNHIDNSLNLINSMVYNDKTITPYANEEIKMIVKNPQVIIDDFMKYQKENSNVEQFYYYYKKLSNLRFSDFMKENENVLSQYDSLISSFIKCNHENIISDILSQESGHFISDMMKYNSFLFDKYIDEFREIFEGNGSSNEKQRCILSLFDKCNLFLGHKGTDTLLIFMRVLFVKSNPNKFLSNFSFLENFYFKIIPDMNNIKLRELFYSTFNYVFPMKKKKLFSSIVPFIGKSINAICISSEDAFMIQNERLLFASDKTFKTYLVTISYTNVYSGSNNFDLLIMKGDKAISSLKSEKIKIKVAICENTDSIQNLKEKYNIHIVGPSQKLKKELKKCILNEYE